MNAHGNMGGAALRSRFWFSTLIFLCQLVCAMGGAGVLAESTLLAQQPQPWPAPATAGAPVTPAGSRDDLLRIVADQQEKFGQIYHLRGNVEITYAGMTLAADEVDYDQSTGSVDARGHVHFQRQANQEDIQARDAHYNLETERGEFYEVRGSIGARQATRERSMLSTTNPYYFEAERVDKVGENTFYVYHGYVTSCRPSEPIWTFSAGRATIKPGESATIYNSFVKANNKVPFFYSPFLYHSLKRLPRGSGFLTPTIGNSSRKGKVLGDSFFWAINRSTDAELGAEVYTERGWAQRGTFRTKPNATTNLSASYYGVVDNGLKLPNGDRLKQGGRTLVVEGSSELPWGFRAVANFNYLSSYRFRLAFTETFLEAVNSEVHSTVFASNNFRGFSLNGNVSRFQNFQFFERRVSGEPVDIRALPSLDFNSVERPLFRLRGNGRDWPLYVSFDSSAGWLSRSEPDVAPGLAAQRPRVSTGFLARFDLNPRLSMPLRARGFQFLSTYGLHATRYGSRFQNGRVVDTALDRVAQEFTFELRPPSLEKVYTSGSRLFGKKFKHVIEPRAEFRLVDGVKEFNEVLRFDERDLLTDTRQVEYGLTNRIFSKRPDGTVRETLAWDVKQVYYFDPTFGGALVAGQRNVFASTLALTPYSFLDGQRRFSPLVSTVRLFPSWNFNGELHSDYDPVRNRIVNTGVTVNGRHNNLWASLSDYYVGSSPVLQLPSHQLRSQFGYGFINRRGFNAATTFLYDLRQDLLPYWSVQTNYNFDCCGFNLEFRRFHFGATLRDERQFRIAITFANIGTFGNLKKQERMF